MTHPPWIGSSATEGTLSVVLRVRVIHGRRDQAKHDLRAPGCFPGPRLPSARRRFGLAACARTGYGPETCAQAASLVSGRHTPVHRATLLPRQLAGIAVSTG